LLVAAQHDRAELGEPDEQRLGFAEIDASTS
jgi:hypothetical protein